MDTQSPPFWFQPPTNRRRHRPQPSPTIILVALILAIPVIALILFFLVPPFLSHTNQILRPNSVKRSWDSLNIVLVLLAILCGVFTRRNDETPPSVDAGTSDNQRLLDSTISNVSSLHNLRPRQSAPAWMYFPDQEYNNITGDVTSGGRLRRSSSSYPDLLQESLWESGGGNRSRIFDDFEVNSYQSPRLPENSERRQWRRSYEAERGEDEPLVREISLYKFEARSAPPPPLKSPAPARAPPLPPQAEATLKQRRSVQSVHQKEKTDRGRDEATVAISVNRRPAPATPPPRRPPPPEFQLSEVISEKVHRKNNGATKEIATSIVSLYKGQVKRKRRGKSRNIHESAAQNSEPPSVKEPQSASSPPPLPPPPPPPPPTSKLLQNLFKKSSKSKRIHNSVLTIAPSRLPPPPPPLPPNSIFNCLIKTVSIKSKRFLQSTIPPPPPPPSTILDFTLKNAITGPLPPPPPPPPRHNLNIGKPPKPTKAKPQKEDDKVFIAPSSPLIPLPPPPPPFRMTKARFVSQGDFVRIRSAHSSRCSSPELENVDVTSVKSDGGDSFGPSILCPSPDVNMKADTFIARLRGEWRLEKINSVKEKRVLG